MESNKTLNKKCFCCDSKILIVAKNFIKPPKTEPKYDGAQTTLKDILVSRATVSGFLVTDWLQEWPQGIARMANWLKNGEIAFKEDISNGLESAPKVMMDMLDGQNFGKALVKIAER